MPHFSTAIVHALTNELHVRRHPLVRVEDNEGNAREYLLRGKYHYATQR